MDKKFNRLPIFRQNRVDHSEEVEDSAEETLESVSKRLKLAFQNQCLIKVKERDQVLNSEWRHCRMRATGATRSACLRVLRNSTEIP